VASISVWNDRTFVRAHHQWMLLPAPTLAEEPAERPLHGLGDVDAFVAGESPGRLMQRLAVLQVLAARRRPSSAKLTRGITRAGATSSARVLTSELSPVLTGASLDVRHGDNNGYVGWPVFPGALGIRKACLCFLRFWQRAADR
jgi:hypothetical protein